jgi:hypothetical protein
VNKANVPLSCESARRATAQLLRQVDLDARFTLRQLEGGRNNRGYRVDVDGESLFLKHYFRHSDDPRDRLAAEHDFCKFAWGNGLRALPRPYAKDAQSGFGLYEFIRGRHLVAGDVAWEEVKRALDFYVELNQLRELPAAADLPRASEASFCIEDHLQCVGQRLQRLSRLQLRDEVDREAAQFVENALRTAWSSVLSYVFEQARATGVALGQTMSPQDRCLSPSDFGFHNALITEEAQLKFVDFEYAGWDDPAKMVCDFFCQVAVPVPFNYFQDFVDTAVASLDNPGECRRRISLLLPVYHIKWCCILMNEFLPTDGGRRRFSHQGVSFERRKREQLQKARHLLCRLQERESTSWRT